MPDRGAKHADKRIAQIDRELRKTYREAQKELEKKLADFNRRFAAQDKKKRQEVRDGKLSEAEYKDWLRRQVFTQQTWERKIAQVESVMLHHNEHAMQIINDSKFDVFAENYYAEAFKVNWIVQGINWEVYNTQALMRLLKDDPDLLPKWKIDQKKDYDWNYQKVNNIIRQGIIQGESVDQLTERLCRDLSSQNESKMRMFARTAITGAQNAGRQVQMEQAAQLGLQVNKKWLATLDNRTRDSHRAMDGEEVPYNEDFSNGLEYPGDPSGSAEEVYNCRCTMITVYPEYEDRSKQWREGETIDGVPYEEWKSGKENAEEKPEEGIAAIKDEIKNHIGEWKTDDLISVGEKFAKEIEKATAQDREDFEKLKKTYEDTKNEIAEIRKQINELDLKGEYGKADELEKRLHELERQRDSISIWRARDELRKKNREAIRETFGKIREIGGVAASDLPTYIGTDRWNYNKKSLREKALEAINYYPKEWLNASASHDVRLESHWTTGRAYYSHYYYRGAYGLPVAEIRFSSSLGTNIHELGHRFEKINSDILKAEKEFYDRRTAGEKLEWLGRGYRRDEKTRRDNFRSAYMGKDYGGSAYELVSMGFEDVYVDYENFYKADPEMANWILGIMAAL